MVSWARPCALHVYRHNVASFQRILNGVPQTKREAKTEGATGADRETQRGKTANQTKGLFILSGAYAKFPSINYFKKKTTFSLAVLYLLQLCDRVQYFEGGGCIGVMVILESNISNSGPGDHDQLLRGSHS